MPKTTHTSKQAKDPKAAQDFLFELNDFAHGEYGDLDNTSPRGLEQLHAILLEEVQDLRKSKNAWNAHHSFRHVSGFAVDVDATARRIEDHAPLLKRELKTELERNARLVVKYAKAEEHGRSQAQIRRLQAVATELDASFCRLGEICWALALAGIRIPVNSDQARSAGLSEWEPFFETATP